MWPARVADCVGTSPTPARLAVHPLRETEVQHLDPAVVADHDVGRLEIAVGDALLVRGRHRVRQGNRDLEEPAERETLSWKQLGQRLPLHQLHRDEVNAAGLFDRVHRDDVGVVERGNRPGLAGEAQAAVVVGGQLRRQDLERHLATERGVLRLIHHAHPAGADLPHDSVVAECLADHRGPSCQLECAA